MLSEGSLFTDWKKALPALAATTWTSRLNNLLSVIDAVRVISASFAVVPSPSTSITIGRSPIQRQRYRHKALITTIGAALMIPVNRNYSPGLPSPTPTLSLLINASQTALLVAIRLLAWKLVNSVTVGKQLQQLLHSLRTGSVTFSVRGHRINSVAVARAEIVYNCMSESRQLEVKLQKVSGGRERDPEAGSSEKSSCSFKWISRCTCECVKSGLFV